MRRPHSSIGLIRFCKRVVPFLFRINLPWRMLVDEIRRFLNRSLVRNINLQAAQLIPFGIDRVRVDTTFPGELPVPLFQERCTGGFEVTLVRQKSRFA